MFEDSFAEFDDAKEVVQGLIDEYQASQVRPVLLAPRSHQRGHSGLTT